MVTSSTLGSVIIEDNIFDYGNYTPDGQLLTTTTIYTYDNCINTNSDAQISGNYFSGIVNQGTHILVYAVGSVSGSQSITNNTFIRNNTAISSYIDLSASLYDITITDNNFDDYTIDGNNETLVLFPSPSVNAPIFVYERNKNQTGILQIQKGPFLSHKSISGIVKSSDTVEYTNNTVSYSQGFVSNFDVLSPNGYKQDGVYANISTPFSPELIKELNGLFTVTNGNNGVIVYTIGEQPYFGLGSLTSGSIVFGDDNVFYPVSSSTVDGSGIITAITLSINYAGTSRTTKARFVPGYDVGSPPHYTPLSYNLPGMFTGTSGTNTVTASMPQSDYLHAGSFITFLGEYGPGAYGLTNIYIVSQVSPYGTSITLSTNLQSNITNALASTGASQIDMNFSINLSELLPSNVRVVDTLFGVYGNNGSILNAHYTANMMTDYGGNFSTLLPGTFSITQNNSTVIASVSQTSNLSAGSSISFSTQPDFVYTVQSISGTLIILTTPYLGTTNASVFGFCFDNSLSDAKNYNITGSAGISVTNAEINIGFIAQSETDGYRPSIPVSTFNTTTQYVKISPEASGFSAFTGSGRLLRYNISTKLLLATPCNNVFIPESPLIVKYRW